MNIKYLKGLSRVPERELKDTACNQNGDGTFPSQNPEEVELENKCSHKKIFKRTALFPENIFPVFHKYKQKDHVFLVVTNTMFSCISSSIPLAYKTLYDVEVSMATE